MADTELGISIVPAEAAFPVPPDIACDWRKAMQILEAEGVDAHIEATLNDIHAQRGLIAFETGLAFAVLMLAQAALRRRAGEGPSHAYPSA